jgi:type IV pilus assembly protein PilW
MRHIAQKLPGRASGFSIVELLVAMVISLIVLAAVSSVLVSTKTTNTAQVAQARMQDNARISVQIMSRGIRQAGYAGCSTPTVGSVTNKLNGSGTAGSADIASPLVGAEAGATTLSPNGEPLPPNALSTSDVIGLSYADGANPLGVETPYMNNVTSEMHVDPASTVVKQFDIVMATDCKKAVIFEVTNDPTGNGSLVHNGGSVSAGPGNKDGSLGTTFDGNASIVKFLSYYYFVANNASGQPSLYRMDAQNYGTYAASGSQCSPSVTSNCWREDELVEGIEQLQVLYGIDTNSDGEVDQYVKANNSALSTPDAWKHIYTVRLGVLARTLADNTLRGDKTSASASPVDLDSNKYDVDGDGTTDFDAGALPATDPARRYQRRVFRTTIMVRNHSVAQSNTP